MEKLINEIPDRPNYKHIYQEIIELLDKYPTAELLVYRKLQMKYSVPRFE